jgi:GAF domain-containing protein/HAMP domain-containing protein
MIRQASLSTKLSLVILTAILIPIVVLGIISFISASNIATENLEAFVAESGSRRLQSIEKEMNTAAVVLQEFIPQNEDRLALRLVDRSDGIVNTGQSDAEKQVTDIFNSELLQTGYFNSVSLVTKDGLQAVQLQPFAAASASRNQLTYNEQNTENIRIGAERLENTDSAGMTFAITYHAEALHITIIHAVFSTQDDDTRILAGYLLADLNLDRIIFINLVREEEPFNAYAYLLFPLTNTLIASPQTDLSLIDITSIGAERIRSRQTGIGHYFVGEAVRREVLGYSEVVQTQLAIFGVVVEVNTSVVSEQLLDQALTLIFPLIVGTVGILAVFLVFISNQMVVPPLNRLRQAVLGMTHGSFDEPVPDTIREDEIGSLAKSFVDMRDHVRNLTDDMNHKLIERTRDVQVIQGISRAVTAERDIQRLMDRVVNLIVNNFPTIYHAQIFLIDEDHEYAVLRSSTGEAGQSLLTRGHKLAVGSVSVIGQVTEQGQVVIARDTLESNVYRRNEFLQETVAELAIPLRLGNEIIGALDVQSKQRDSFDADQVSALQTLADQVTIGLENARLYSESERLIANIEREHTARTRTNWQEYLYDQRQTGIQKQAGIQTDYNFSHLAQAVYTSGEAIVGDRTKRDTIPFAVPIVFRGQVLGVAEYEVSHADFSYDKVLLAEELVSRMAISLENARLFQTSHQAVERERIVNEISTKLTGQTDIEDIIQTAIQEIGQALRTPQVAVRLQMRDSNGATNNGTQKSTNDTSTDESSL